MMAKLRTMAQLKHNPSSSTTRTVSLQQSQVLGARWRPLPVCSSSLLAFLALLLDVAFSAFRGASRCGEVSPRKRLGCRVEGKKGAAVRWSDAFPAGCAAHEVVRRFASSRAWQSPHAHSGHKAGWGDNAPVSQCGERRPFGARLGHRFRQTRRRPWSGNSAHPA